ncbi:tail fiber protein [Xenorhabdus stockiae]|uniref:Tail fiber protein n=1 Tax=Xenorhabdus stockiae TaxID=351614 RepID=A0A2D0KLM1_9GAMM|nr:tape measure protein [Xenorhabdus stockiae]PHM64127.1 tail fiber protein [Xenorhabdus stockiae]
MAEHRVGNLVYQVQMDVAQLLTAQRQVDERLNRMEQSFNQTGRAVQGAEKALSSVSKVATALTSALSVQQVAAYAEAWTVVSNKLVNSVRANEQLIDVTNRVFQISQDTRTSLDATATLYGRLERGTREYNTSAKDLARLTEIINQGFIVSGATATEAENAIIQLSQGIASGVLRGEEFNSVAEQGSRIMVALADSLGVNIGQLRKMAAEGKLTTDVVVKGLLSQGNAIAKEFTKTTMTMGQAMQVASNNLTKFFGESATIKSGINAFNDAIISLSNNMETVSNVVLVAAAVMGSRFVGALTLATKNKLESAAASIGEARATQISAQNALYAAQAATRKAWADRDAAVSALNLAQAEYNVAKGTAAEAFALDNLNAKKSAAIATSTTYAQAKNVEIAATERSVVANRAANVALTGLKGSLALVGGPAGAAMLAASALYFFHSKAKEASEEAKNLAEGVDNLLVKMREMNRVQLMAEASKLRQALPELSNNLLDANIAYSKAKSEVNKYTKQLKEAKDGSQEQSEASRLLSQAQDKLNIAIGDTEKAYNNYNNAKRAAGILDAKANGTLLEGAELLTAHTRSVLPSAEQAWRSYGLSLKNATQEQKEFNAEYLKIKLDWGGEEGEKLIKQAERRLALSKLEGKARAEQQGKYAAEDAGITDERAITRLKEVYTQIWENEAAGKEANKKSAKSTDEATEALKRQKEALERLNTGYKEGSVQMAQYDAVKALGEKATSKQIAQAKEAATALYKIDQQHKDKKAALEKDAFAKAEQIRKLDSEQLERQLKSDLVTEEQYERRRLEIATTYAKAIAEAKANKIVTPQQELTAQVDPVQELANRHAKQLEMIRKFETEKGELTQRGIELMNAANTKYEQDRLNASWEIWRNQSEANQFLANSLDALGQRSANAITGLLTGTQTADEAMRNLALTIANEAVSALVQMGMQQIKNMVIGKAANTAAKVEAVATGATITTAMAPAAAATSVATMGTAATVGMAAMTAAVPAMIALLGARKNGGPVSPNGAYRIGENNKPEIFKANNGHQYMIPGDRGKVVSNREMGKGGVGTSVGSIHIAFHVQTQGNFSEQDARMMSGMVRKTIYDVLTDESRPGGMLNQ